MAAEADGMAAAVPSREEASANMREEEVLAVLARIQVLTAAFLAHLEDGVLMDIEALDRRSDAMMFDAEKQRLVHNNKTRIIRLHRGGARKYTGIWLVLHTVHELLLEKKTITQREMYYLHSFFKTQREADEAILDVASVLRVPRACLNIVGATKGCFVGSLMAKIEDTWVDFTNGDEHPITQQLLQCDENGFRSNAQFIVVIEKDGIFNRLREDRFHQARSCILVTGRGFPDLATRLLVSRLNQALNLPVFGLCDCNPFGLSIMTTYMIGSSHMPLDNHVHVPVKWIGLRPSILEHIQFPTDAYKPLSPKDMSTAYSLASSPFLQSNPMIMAEIERWVGGATPWKVELEAMHLLGFDFLARFIRHSIDEHKYI